LGAGAWGRVIVGVLWIVTVGLFTVGWIIDLIPIIVNNKKRGFCQKSAFFGRPVKEPTGFLNK
jgi:hypothetical protein